MKRDKEDYVKLSEIADRDVDVLQEKGRHYGRSWIKRGGVGAFMMFARKWDRIEEVATRNGYDIIKACREDLGADLLDDVQDLRRYLLLLEGELIALAGGVQQKEASAPPQLSPREDSDSELQMRAQPRPGRHPLDSEAPHPSLTDGPAHSSFE